MYFWFSIKSICYPLMSNMMLALVFCHCIQGHVSCYGVLCLVLCYKSLPISLILILLYNNHVCMYVCMRVCLLTANVYLYILSFERNCYCCCIVWLYITPTVTIATAKYCQCQYKNKMKIREKRNNLNIFYWKHVISTLFEKIFF